MIIKRFFLVVLTSCFFLCCKKEKTWSYEELNANYNEAIANIEALSYNVRRVDSFPSADNNINVWDNNGFALLERDPKDTVFGYNLYGKMNNKPLATIYDQGNVFYLNDAEKTYEQEKGGYYILGSPGGQMISTSFFKLDSIYDSVEVKPNDFGYEIQYTFANDTVYLISDRVKTVQLNKQFLPTQVRTSYLRQGDKQTIDFFISDIALNNDVKQRISDKKSMLTSYEREIEEESLPSPLLGKKLPEFAFKDIHTGNAILLETDKLMLLDFWEVWCGWCIKAFPKVDKLQETYADDLQVLGVVTETKEKAVDMIASKNSLIAHSFMDKTIINAFNINSYPRYYLIDQNGIIKKEYFGFSEQIETDIKTMINEAK